MWDSTDFNVLCRLQVESWFHLRTLILPLRAQIKVRGIPHLAKNERDVGHPSFVARKGWVKFGSAIC
jgi:hypothetical protein